MIRLVALAAAALACSGRPPQVAERPAGSTPADARPAPDAPLDQDLPRLAERSLALYREVARVFAEAGEQCAIATEKLGELSRRYGDIPAANAKVLREGRARDLEAALAPHDAQFEEAARGIFSAKTLSACAQDAAFTKSFDDLLGAPP